MLDILSSYDYRLPAELIAQYPSENRENARLLTVRKADGKLGDRVFADIVNLLDKNSFLVINDTRVVRARLPATKITGGRSEVFYLRSAGKSSFYALVKGKHKRHEKLLLPDNRFVTLEEQTGDGRWLVSSDTDVENLLERYGKVPLPPYILRAAEGIDAERYQTVYAKYNGSAAAPTAGLHFTEDILKALEKKGVPIIRVTLHVGTGTFAPIKSKTLSEHKMHGEVYHISQSAAERINDCKVKGLKLIAVGTTTVRALESAADDSGIVRAGENETQLFIKPGYNFKAVDGIITNFHLPKSTLLVLVCAFLGYEKTRKAYERAVEQKYRFFSYGDAMLIKE